MKIIIGMALLIFGGSLTVYGFNAADAVNPHLSGLLAGAPNTKTIFLFATGTAMAVVGGSLALSNSRRI